MPQGCEDKFAWAKGLNDILKTKYPYGKLYALRTCRVNILYIFNVLLLSFTRCQGCYTRCSEEAWRFTEGFYTLFYIDS